MMRRGAQIDQVTTDGDVASFSCARLAVCTGLAILPVGILAQLLPTLLWGLALYLVLLVALYAVATWISGWEPARGGSAPFEQPAVAAGAAPDWEATEHARRKLQGAAAWTYLAAIFVGNFFLSWEDGDYNWSRLGMALCFPIMAALTWREFFKIRRVDRRL